MDVEAALKKIFAKLDELSSRIDALDTNGRLDEIQKELQVVSSNSQVVVSTVQEQGGVLERVEKTAKRLNIRCPLLKPGTDQVRKIVPVPGGGGEL